jgi:ABC-type bacteriocin/lantibiotic exporter with double-glycine peptidase domain
MLGSSERQYASGRTVFRMYFAHARKYPVLLSLVILGAIGIQITDLAAPWYLRQFFNVLAMHNPDAAMVSTLVGLVATIGLIYFSNWAIRRVQDFSNIYFESRVMTDLFSSTFQYLIGHSYNFFISHFAGSLTHKVSKFARAFEVMFDALTQQFFPTFLFVAGAVTVLFIRNHVLGAVLGIWAVLFVLFQLYVARLRQPARATSTRFLMRSWPCGARRRSSRGLRTTPFGRASAYSRSRLRSASCMARRFFGAGACSPSGILCSSKPISSRHSTAW